MQNAKGTKLPDLPPSKDGFWEYSTKYSADMTNKKEKCKHHFTCGAGREVVCEKCNVGFYLLGGEKLVGGEIVV